MRVIFACAAALLLAACANSDIGSLPGLSSNSAAPKPKTIIVTDFVWGDGVTAIDRTYTVRLERKIGSFPPHERKPRTLERVNEEVVASIIATLRNAGLDAQPGAEDSVAEAVIVGGTLRGTGEAPADRKPRVVDDQVGFGTGRPNVVADIKVSRGRRSLTSFTAEAGGRGAAAGARQSASQNAAIATALAEQKSAPEKLSPNVEAQARQLGRAVGDKVVAYAREQGWLEANVATAEPEAPVRVAARSERKQAKKPAAAPAPAADEKPED